MGNYNGTLTMLDSRGGNTESTGAIDSDVNQDMASSQPPADLDIDDEIPF